ncbi:MAG: polysaccharide deacetylase family protein [Rhodospirillaceae bacterium]
MTADLFADCLSFFCDHYNLIGLSQLNTALAGGERLPHHPLLVTFDDGWADTLDCAAGLLGQMGVPAACFVASEALEDPAPTWWQDAFALAWRSGHITERNIRDAWTAVDAPPIPGGEEDGANSYLRCLAMMHDLPHDVRAGLLEHSLTAYDPKPVRQMLRPDEVRQLVAAGIEIGAHGHSHLPLTMCRNVLDDLVLSRDILRDLIAGSRQTAITALSIPHGRFSENVALAARAAGFRFVFTSRSRLGHIAHGRAAGDVNGRIEISANHVTDSTGRFAPERLALLTFPCLTP